MKPDPFNVLEPIQSQEHATMGSTRARPASADIAQSRVPQSRAGTLLTKATAQASFARFL